MSFTSADCTFYSSLDVSRVFCNQAFLEPSTGNAIFILYRYRGYMHNLSSTCPVEILVIPLCPLGLALSI
jgi:hypothetical protein